MARIPADTMILQMKFATREIAKGKNNKEIAKKVEKEYGYPISAKRLNELRQQLEKDQKPGGRLAARVVELKDAPKRKKRVKRTEEQPEIEESEEEAEERRAADGGEPSRELVAKNPQMEDLVEIDLPEDLRESVHTVIEKFRAEGFTKVMLDVESDPPVIKYERMIRAQTTLV